MGGRIDSDPSREGGRFDSDPNRTRDSTRERYVALSSEALDRKLLTEIRRGTEKEIGIGQADFLLRVTRLFST